MMEQINIQLRFSSIDSGHKSWSKNVSDKEDTEKTIREIIRTTLLPIPSAESTTISLERKEEDSSISFIVSVNRSGPLYNMYCIPIIVLHEKHSITTVKKEFNFKYEMDSSIEAIIDKIISCMCSIIFDVNSWEQNKLNIVDLML